MPQKMYTHYLISKLQHVHRGCATGKIYNIDRQCFLNWELKSDLYLQR